MVVGK